MSTQWNTVERHGQPPEGSLVQMRNESRPFIAVTFVVSWSPVVRWLPPGTTITLGELPGWDEVRPPPMSDAQRRAVRLCESHLSANGIYSDGWRRMTESEREGFMAVQAEALRMAADLLDEHYGYGTTFGASYLRLLADEG